MDTNDTWKTSVNEYLPNCARVARTDKHDVGVRLDGLQQLFQTLACDWVQHANLGVVLKGKEELVSPPFAIVPMT
jgi:hypothetical protein